jgi:hypothetical protein
MLKKMNSSEATGNDIVAITGPLDNEILDAILHTHATRAEIAQALNWLEESYYTMTAATRPMSERTRRVYQILDYASTEVDRNLSIH